MKNSRLTTATSTRKEHPQPLQCCPEMRAGPLSTPNDYVLKMISVNRLLTYYRNFSKAAKRVNLIFETHSPFFRTNGLKKFKFLETRI